MVSRCQTLPSGSARRAADSGAVSSARHTGPTTDPNVVAWCRLRSRPRSCSPSYARYPSTAQHPPSPSGLHHSPSSSTPPARLQRYSMTSAIPPRRPPVTTQQTVWSPRPASSPFIPPPSQSTASSNPQHQSAPRLLRPKRPRSAAPPGLAPPASTRHRTQLCNATS